MTHNATIHVTGADAFEFLQGQLSSDLARLETEPEILAAWCNPKGRVIWFGFVRTLDEGYGLCAPSETADDIVRRLTVFRFRSKVSFSVADDEASAAAEALIKQGLPFIGTRQLEKFTPHMLNLDLLRAIDFDKGCYTGQEIVARTHYKGATKRRTFRFDSETPVSVGDNISLDGRDIGEVLNTSGTDLLAVVPVDKVTEKLDVNGVAITLVPLHYMSDLNSSNNR